MTGCTASDSKVYGGVHEEHEKAYIQAQCETCERLLSFCDSKSLSRSQRASLLDWIVDHMMSVSSNPFSAQLDIIGEDLISAALYETLTTVANLKCFLGR